MLLSALLKDVSGVKILAGNTDIEVNNIVFDSRKTESGSLFVAIRGTATDGHRFIQNTIEKGAKVILFETPPTDFYEGITYLQAENPARAMGLLAKNFYGDPSAKIKLIGVTGTNGKTTNVTLLFRLFRALGYRCGLLSTVQNQIEDDIVPSTHTTPDVLKINELLIEMADSRCEYVFMEVSSHAVVQERIAGLTFRMGIFTNITRDHLDFHGTFENYIKAKKGFFDQLPSSAIALVNADDPRGRIMVQNTAAQKQSFSLITLATYHGKLLSDSVVGLEMEIAQQTVHFKLIGNFNAYNLLGVYGAAVSLGEDPAEVLVQLSGIEPPRGRFEQVLATDGRVGIVDFAHTPDALENVLETIAGLRTEGQKIITVVGCGGNRDAGKRPEMAAIACKWSDSVVLTSDNPRNEDPLDILAQMKAGITDNEIVTVISDRREAIRFAVASAQKNDVILVAGKGHENYQEIKGVKHHFDDREELINAFQV